MCPHPQHVQTHGTVSYRHGFSISRIVCVSMCVCVSLCASMYCFCVHPCVSVSVCVCMSVGVSTYVCVCVPSRLGRGRKSWERKPETGPGPRPCSLPSPPWAGCSGLEGGCAVASFLRSEGLGLGLRLKDSLAGTVPRLWERLCQPPQGHRQSECIWHPRQPHLP